FPAPPATPRAPRSEAMTPTALKAGQRARAREAEQATARAALEVLLTLEDVPASGERITAPGLYELACPLMEEAVDMRVGIDADELAEQSAEDGFPDVVRVPGPRTFYAVADELLGARRRGAQGRQTYIIPDPINLEKEPMHADDILAE